MASRQHHEAWFPNVGEEDWRLRGACRGNPEPFYHPDGERGLLRKQRQEVAKAICRACPVIEQCYEYSIRAREPYGTWGGVTEEERLRLLSRASAAGSVEAS